MVITNDGTGPALKVTQTGANSLAEFYDAESGIAMMIANDGMVGVGTSTPTARLHVSKTDTGDIFRIDDEPNETTPFIIKDNGNVGIGTTTPIRSLDVVGSVRLGASGSALSILDCENPIVIGGCLSDETTALTTSNSLTIFAPYKITIRSTKLPKFTTNTNATSTITFDITVNGTTIYATKPTIASSTKISTSGALTTNPRVINENDVIVASVNIAGAGGTGAKVYIYST
jgi:hypothetical protein